MTGQQVYQAMARGQTKVGAMSKPEASEYLNSLGIKGIKYLDQASRGSGEGTRNLVVFDDSIVKILKRNEKPID